MKKWITALLACSLVFVNVAAAPAVENTAVEIATVEIDGEPLHAASNIVLGGEEVQILDGITAEPGAAPAHTGPNTPPVAELYPVALNPETLKNGNITTATQVAWLWSYNGTNFTYDPDGDVVTNVNIGGIPQSAVLGSISGAGEGFATQFSEAAQYELLFRAADEHGAWSSTVTYLVNVEPAGANNRPTAKIMYDYNTLFVNGRIQIDWSGSTDPDAGDSVESLRGFLVSPDGTQTDIKKFHTGGDGKVTFFAFPTAGEYRLRLSVGDTHGAWSDWKILPITVKEGSALQDVRVDTQDHASGSKYYFLKGSDVNPTEDPDIVYHNYRFLGSQQGTPYNLPLVRYISISGYVRNADGTPKNNAKVWWKLPLRDGVILKDYVYTNGNGYFAYSISSKEYFDLIGGLRHYDYGDKRVVASGILKLDNTSYLLTNDESSATSYYCKTTFTIEAGGAKYDMPCVATMGNSTNLVLNGCARIKGSQWRECPLADIG